MQAKRGPKGVGISCVGSTTRSASVDVGTLTRNKRTAVVAALARDVGMRRACRRAGCSQSAARGLRSCRAGVRPSGLPRAARLCFWRTRLRRVHAAHASPRRVRAFGRARACAAPHLAARPAASGATSLLAHAPATCARGARFAAHGPCGVRPEGALLVSRLQTARAAAGGAHPLLAHAPVACEFSPRIAVQGAHDPQKALLAGWSQIVLVAANGALPLLAHAPVTCAHGALIPSQGACISRLDRCFRGVMASDCPCWFERRASASGARADDVRTRRTCRRAGCAAGGRCDDVTWPG